MGVPARTPTGSKPPRRRYLPVALTAVTGLVATILVVTFIWRQDLAVRDAHFHRRGSNLAGALQQHVDRDIQILESVAHLYAASAEVREDEFGRFVREPLARHPELLGLCWAPRVQASARAALEESARASGIPDFQIQEPGPDGGLRPAGDRAEYVPLLFVEPPGPILRLQGIDLGAWSEPARALENALDSGAASASGPIALPAGIDARPEAMLILPIFSTDVPPTTAEGRRVALEGFVVGILHLDELVAHSSRKLDTELLELALVDVTDPERALLLHPAPGTVSPAALVAEAGTPPAGGLERSVELEVPGRRWVLRVRPAPEFFSVHQPTRPWWILLSCLAVTIMLSALVLVAVRRTDRIERLAAELAATNRDLQAEMAERRQSEEAVRRSEERYRLLVERNLAGVYRSTLDGQILMCNDAFARMFGFSTREEAAARPAVDYYSSPDQRLRSVELLQRFGELHNHELTLLRKDGTLIPVLMSSSIVADDDESERVIEGILLDISELRKAEEALRLTQFSVDRSADGVFWMGADARLVYINDAACRSLGYTREELLGMSVAEFDLDFPTDAWPTHWEEIRSQGSLTFESRHRRKDGAVIPVEITANFLNFEGREYNCAFARDIGQRKKQEQERQDLQAQLHQAQKLESLGVLAGGIAHDFNNMLMTIMGNVGLAKLLTRGQDQVEARLAETEKACLRARDLTQQLLTFSKGGAPLRKPVGIAELIRESASFAARGTSSQVETSVAEDLSAADVDEGQIGQVIQNLVINAAQAMPQGGLVTVHAEDVTVETDEVPPLSPGRYVRITTHDHGIGVPTEHLKRIFDPFFSTKQSGSGLGLATAFSIARSHGGTITVESDLGKGSSFSLWVPASDESVAPVAEPAGPPRGEGRVLIMDDDDAVREVTAGMLESLGYSVEVATDGARAVEAYTRASDDGRPFDVVVLDLTVRGGMGGREAMKRLLELDPDVRAIVSSGYSTDPVMADYRHHGFRGVAAKPYSAADLARTIEEVMGGGSGNDE